MIRSSKPNKLTKLPKGGYIIVPRELMLRADEGLHCQFDLEVVKKGEAIQDFIIAKGERIPCIFLSIGDLPHEKIRIGNQEIEIYDDQGEYFLFSKELAPNLFNSIFEFESDEDYAENVSLPKDVPTASIQGIQHKCPLELPDCKGEECIDTIFDVEKKSFQILVAKNFGLFCFFEDDIPQIVIDSREVSKKEMDEIGKALSQVWEEDIHIVDIGRFFFGKD